MALATFLTVFWLASQQQACGQFVSQQVGGVSIDAQGVVKKVNVDQLGELLRVRKDAFQPVSGDLQKQALRKISLRQLEAAIAAHRKDGTPITDDMRYLAGLQRIQYVFVFPEQNDIVIAGPGEGWRISPEGEIVGATTNRPVMLLDDLLVAFRAIEALRQTGISCSIDPTADGLVAVPRHLQNTAHCAGRSAALAERHRRSARPANDHGDGRAQCHALRPRAGGGRLPHETAGDGLRQAADRRAARLPANGQGRRAARNR